jgi:hypothetical protein
VFVASELTDSVAARVQEILASAHDTAETVREQAAAATREMIAQAQQTVDGDTERIRRDVEARAAQYLAECHRRVDAFADARVRRLRELSDSLIEQTDALHGRFDQVVRLKRQLDDLIEVLGDATEQVARELKRPPITLPTLGQFHGETDGQPGERGPLPVPVHSSSRIPARAPPDDSSPQSHDPVVVSDGPDPTGETRGPQPAVPATRAGGESPAGRPPDAEGGSAAPKKTRSPARRRGRSASGASSGEAGDHPPGTETP